MKTICSLNLNTPCKYVLSFAQPPSQIKLAVLTNISTFPLEFKTLKIKQPVEYFDGHLILHVAVQLIARIEK